MKFITPIFIYSKSFRKIFKTYLLNKKTFILSMFFSFYIYNLKGCKTFLKGKKSNLSVAVNYIEEY